MTVDLNQARARMQDAIGHLKGELAQIRTGRANVALVSDIPVEVYATKMKVRELAAISAPEPTVLLVSPWDKSIITNVVGGIARANIGLNPVVDGDLIRIVIPPLTSERRDQIIRQMHSILEKYRVEIRQIRHEARESLQSLKQSGDISEDEEARLQLELQKMHDEFIEVVEVAGKVKEQELREV